MAAALTSNANCESEAPAMPYCDILRKPYFNVPPEDPRVDLLLKQASRPVRVRAFSYTAKDGRAFVSPYVYFGTILIYGDDAEKDAEARARNAVRAVCGSAFSLFAGRAGTNFLESMS